MTVWHCPFRRGYYVKVNNERRFSHSVIGRTDHCDAVECGEKKEENGKRIGTGSDEEIGCFESLPQLGRLAND